MKVLIWCATIFVTALITTILNGEGLRLGAIPTIIIYGLMIWVARTLCRKYDERNAPKNKPVEHIDVNRHKDSATLGRDPLTPYCTKRRYQNKDWATIETFLNTTLCGENGEELLFKHRSTTTIGRSATNIELIYIFDSFTKSGEKYSELYVCDECTAETTVPPVGYRFANDPVTQEKHSPSPPTICLSSPDFEPTARGNYNIRGSEVMLEQPDECSPFTITAEPPAKKDEEPPQQPKDCPPAEKKPEIRFCRNCGSQLVPNSRFCSQCGTEIAKG